ncbi:prepilin-type N-terminal cleavage/methylation domain-containing protein [Floridanema evergladense]|uniref:Prepilin-type N-terminal cleavage/methylation domain-containing protein n=1 Tax=Floridaenema evergladense BLCC-F167 TaxID=3153639 RepID=A0ABV4WRD1_9CYAN
MTKVWQTLLKTLPLSRKRHKKHGFTLIELLVTILISAVIITALLSFVIDLLQTDRREYARAETQREMETALNFIVDDLREAVYIYDKVDQQRSNSDRLQNFIPTQFNGATATPVLAFWKAQRLNDADLPSNCGDNDAECKQVTIRRRAYSLIVYYVAKNPANDPKWRGKARIIRYAFNKYPSLPSLGKTNGYRDPAEESSFENWPNVNGSPGGSAANQGAGTMQAVLVDFVDDPENQSINPSQVETCTSSDPNSPFYSTDPSNNPTYRRIPDLNSNNRSNSFYVCIKTLGTVAGTNQQEKLNQDVILFLRGNPIGRVNANDTQPLLTVRAGAIARGVIDKKP